MEKEYVTKTITLKANDPNVSEVTTKAMLKKLTDKVKELRLLKQEIVKEKKKKIKAGVKEVEHEEEQAMLDEAKNDKLL